MPVVSNTSPVLNLAIIGRIDLLHRQFGEVWIPPGVYDELRVETDLPGTAAIKQALRAGWLKIIPLEQTQMVSILRRDLDQGEAEALALTLEKGMAEILLDEAEAREAARSLGLTPIGILGVLLRAKQMGAITSVGETMKALGTQAGFFIAKKLYSRLIAMAGEK